VIISETLTLLYVYLNVSKHLRPVLLLSVSVFEHVSKREALCRTLNTKIKNKKTFLTMQSLMEIRGVSILTIFEVSHQYSKLLKIKLNL
jgi:hypothetical protein